MVTMAMDIEGAESTLQACGWKPRHGDRGDRPLPVLGLAFFGASFSAGFAP